MFKLKHICLGTLEICDVTLHYHSNTFMFAGIAPEKDQCVSTCSFIVYHITGVTFNRWGHFDIFKL